MKRTLCVFCGLVLCIAGVMTGSLQAQTTRYLDPGGVDTGDCSDPGNPCASISYALTVCAQDDTIDLSPGQYDVSSEVLLDQANHQGLSFVGNQADVDPRPSAGTIRDPDDPVTESIIDLGYNDAELFDIRVSDVTFNGLVLRNTTADIISQRAAASGTAVRYCIIYNSSGDEGVQLRSVTNGIVEYNHIFDVAEDCVCIADNSVNTVIRFNELNDSNSRNGMIYIYYSNLIDVHDNLIYNHTYPGADICAAVNTYHNDGSHIYLNTIHDCTQAGIQAEAADLGGTGLLAEHNTIYNCGYGIRVHRPYTDPSGGLITFFENNIYNNTVAADYTVSSGLPGMIAAEYNWWGDAGGPYDADGSTEVPVCNADPLDDLNILGTSGDPITGGDYWDYCPWLDAPWSLPTPTPLPTSTPPPTATSGGPTPTPAAIPATDPIGLGVLLVILGCLLGIGFVRRQ
jgi:Right handed beta helix region